MSDSNYFTFLKRFLDFFNEFLSDLFMGYDNFFPIYIFFGLCFFGFTVYMIRRVLFE